ncbi:MAG: ATP-binding protein [Phycisphaerales bacterium]
MSSASPLLGQPAAVRAFTRALHGHRLHHAWILHGPEGVGKMLAARLLAGLVLDRDASPAHRQALAPPTDSEDARLIRAGTHPDFIVIHKELARHSANRELRERKQLNIPLDLLRETLIGGTDSEGRQHDAAAFRTATRGHGKVFVIDQAELLEPEAQHALLKTLEEPPPRTYLLLLTTRLDRLLPTIRSRCQQVAFGPLDAEAMLAWLQAHPLQARGEVAEWIGRFAEGSPGAALQADAHDLHAWWTAFQSGFQAMDAGTFPGGLAEAMQERAAAFAEGVVKANEFASKEAANRQGLWLVVRLCGLHLRERLAQACLDDDRSTIAVTLEAMEALERFQENVRANVNAKLAVSELVAEWTQAGRAEPVRA